MPKAEDKTGTSRINPLDDSLLNGSPGNTEGAISQPVRCEGCGAALDASLSECAFCGTKILAVLNLENETRTLLTSLENRLQEAVALRTDLVLIIVFFLFLASGPACYSLLDIYTETGLLTRISLAIVTALFGFFVFGSQCESRERQAEEIAWRDSIGPETRLYADRKDLANTEFIALTQRLLGEDSRLRKVISKWMIG